MIYIITINYNNSGDTIDCLERLKTVLTPCRVIVVDNASSLDDYEVLSQYIEQIGGILLHTNEGESRLNDGNYFLIRSAINLGFSGGNNVGIRIAMSQPNFDGVVLLNNDTLVDPTFLDELLRCRSENEDAHLIGGRIFYEDAPNKLWYDGGVFNKYTCKAIHINDNKLISEVVGSNEPHKTGFITGCLMYISPYCLENIGLLDDSFFMYSEDLDYCIRAQRFGLNLYFVPRSIIWHKVSSSTGGILSAFSAYWISRNKFRIARLYLNRFEQATTCLYFWGTRVPRYIKWFLQGRKDVIKAQVKGAFDGMKGK